ncbi:hypothetical protein HDU67_002716 [Dinochytrium kinnereticum]|nr:hypothetical protein HDU67_002716 [Dinochytrium kinnereticum]
MPRATALDRFDAPKAAQVTVPNDPEASRSSGAKLRGFRQRLPREGQAPPTVDMAKKEDLMVLEKGRPLPPKKKDVEYLPELEREMDGKGFTIAGRPAASFEIITEVIPFAEESTSFVINEFSGGSSEDTSPAVLVSTTEDFVGHAADDIPPKRLFIADAQINAAAITGLDGHDGLNALGATGLVTSSDNQECEEISPALAPATEDAADLGIDGERILEPQEVAPPANAGETKVLDNDAFSNAVPSAADNIGRVTTTKNMAEQQQHHATPLPSYQSFIERNVCGAAGKAINMAGKIASWGFRIPVAGPVLEKTVTVLLDKVSPLTAVTMTLASTVRSAEAPKPVGTSTIASAAGPTEAASSESNETDQPRGRSTTRSFARPRSKSQVTSCASTKRCLPANLKSWAIHKDSDGHLFARRWNKREDREAQIKGFKNGDPIFSQKRVCHFRSLSGGPDMREPFLVDLTHVFKSQESRDMAKGSVIVKGGWTDENSIVLEDGPSLPPLFAIPPTGPSQPSPTPSTGQTPPPKPSSGPEPTFRRLTPADYLRIACAAYHYFMVQRSGLYFLGMALALFLYLMVDVARKLMGNAWSRFKRLFRVF